MNERKHNITEELGQALADVAEKTELNKTALGFAARLDRLTAEKRDDIIRSLDSLFGIMRPVWAQESTQEMDFDKEPAPEPTPEPEDTNVVGLAAAQQFQRTRKPAKKPETVDHQAADQL
jgi:hypothetical protein